MFFYHLLNFRAIFYYKTSISIMYRASTIIEAKDEDALLKTVTMIKSTRGHSSFHIQMKF